PGVVDGVGEGAADQRGRQQRGGDQPGPPPGGGGAGGGGGGGPPPAAGGGWPGVPAAAAAGAGGGDPGQRRDAEQQRPDQVELLLDRQRPEVLDGGGGPGGLQVVARLAGQLPVLEVQRAGPDLGGDVGE